jgi:hypothetical protein
MLILSVVMFFEILFVFGTIQMILLLNVCLPLCMVLLIRISAKKIWNAMDNFEISYNDPWVCIGDFNAITSLDDKLGVGLLIISPLIFTLIL